MARVTLAEGEDDEHGGVFAERHDDGRLDDDKHWWMQAEAVVGFLNAFELTGEGPFLDAAERAWGFVERFLIDREHGEWRWRVRRRRRADPGPAEGRALEVPVPQLPRRPRDDRAGRPPGSLTRLSGSLPRIESPALTRRFPVRFLGVALVSLATLVLELTLTRLFSATMFYHFAFLAISLALFGSGASGVFVYVVRPRLDERARRLVARRSPRGCSALSTVVAAPGDPGHPLSPVEPGPLDAGVARLDLRRRRAAVLLLGLRHHARHHAPGPRHQPPLPVRPGRRRRRLPAAGTRCSACFGAIDTVLLVAAARRARRSAAREPALVAAALSPSALALLAVEPRTATITLE